MQFIARSNSSPKTLLQSGTTCHIKVCQSAYYKICHFHYKRGHIYNKIWCSFTKSMLLLENVSSTCSLYFVVEDRTENLSYYLYICEKHCVKSVRIRSYSCPYFPVFGLNTERYGVSLRILYQCGKMRTRITSNTDTFHAVKEITWIWILKLNWKRLAFVIIKSDW